MTATVQPTGVVFSAAADSGISRLNPSDGLFLRAEHLQRIQHYARELALSVGLASGPGVVYGYHVQLSGKTLTIGPGLAIDAAGQPLRSMRPVELPLDKLGITNDQFLIVQVVKGQPQLSGTENVYGTLCDDPCSPATIQPFADEGVIVQLATGSFDHLGEQPQPQRRNWLASRYFEQERIDGKPWLVPGGNGPSLRQLWSEVTGKPQPGAVPIAVLLYVDKQWVLDVWTARRDIGDPLPRRDWQQRLGLRPWSVFLAQVLQFQAQLAEAAGPGTGARLDERRIKLLDEVLEAFNALAVKPRKLKKALTDLHGAEHPVLAAADLPTHGFCELPPAGFLPQPDGVEHPDQYYRKLLGDDVEVRVCDCAADFALRAVEQAQHLDRIPLNASPPPKIDVLVPTQGADLPALQATNGYGWVAFVRRREATCGEDPVDVYIYYVDAESQTPDKAAEILIDQAGHGQLDTTKFIAVATVSYPAGGWAVPTGGPAYGSIQAAWKKEQPRPGQWAVVSIASSEDRRPLATVRATLLTVPLQDGEAFANAPRIYSASAKNLATEVIVVIFASQGVLS